MNTQPKKKKPYVQPIIEFEDFTLSAEIAVICEITRVNATNTYECGYINDFGQNVFNQPYLTGCKDVQEVCSCYTDPRYGTICRSTHEADGYPNLFIS